MNKNTEFEKLKGKQRGLEVSKELYDSYSETHCRANDIAINLYKEFSFMEQQQIIPAIQEGIRILRFKRDKYKQTLDNIKDICNTYQMEYIVNNGVKLLTTKILQIIEGKENE